ncbi:MAG: hypothetical protein IJQ89_11005 [Bacteroidales bacterium]|nr:hypothetical protein [Bacteroidales bacterium]
MNPFPKKKLIAFTIISIIIIVFQSCSLLKKDIYRTTVPEDYLVCVQQLLFPTHSDNYMRKYRGVEIYVVDTVMVVYGIDWNNHLIKHMHIKTIEISNSDMLSIKILTKQGWNEWDTSYVCHGMDMDRTKIYLMKDAEIKKIEIIGFTKEKQILLLYETLNKYLKRENLGLLHNWLPKF